MTSLVALPHTEDHTIHSRHVGADFHVWIGHPVPGMFGPSPLKPRVLYVLDADLYFGAALNMTRIMHQLYGELPPILVVGIAYGGGDPGVQAQLRNRDFTPTSSLEYEQMIARMGSAPILPEGQRLGRAAQFLAFLQEEARPFVEQRFDVSAEHSILFGSSFGGLFALWTALTAPESFASYIAVSPAIWWDNEVLFALQERTDRTDLKAGLFLAVGAMEENPAIPMLAQFKMITNVNRMHETLAAQHYPSLRLAAEVIAGETHTSVVVPALIRGLRMLAPR